MIRHGLRPRRVVGEGRRRKIEALGKKRDQLDRNGKPTLKGSEQDLHEIVR
jgi:hypothetical protein